MTDAAEFVPAFDSPLVLRDALVRALCFATQPEGEPRAHLVAIDAASAQLLLREQAITVHLVAWDGSGAHPYDDVTHRLERIARGARVGTTHVVLCGGPRDAQRVLEPKNTFRLLERRLAVHHVREDGEVWDAGKQLRLLRQAVSEQVSIASTGIRVRALDSGEVLVLREGHRQLVEAERAFGRRLVAVRPVVTLGLLALAAVLFALENLWGSPESGPTLYRLGAIVPDRILAGEVWRLLAGTLLHGGLGHLLVNGLGLWVVGAPLERLVGPSRYTIVYVASAIAGSIASAAMIGDRVSVGASGALFGLLGAVLPLVRHPTGLLPPSLALRIKQVLWPLLAVFALYSLRPDVDGSAHLGGFLAGLGIAASGLLTRGLVRGVPAGPAPRGLRVAAVIAGVLLVASAIAPIVVERPWQLAQSPRLVEQVLGETGFSIRMPEGLARLPAVVDEARATFPFGDMRRDLVKAAVTVYAEPEDDAASKLEEIREDAGNSTDLRVGTEPRLEHIDGEAAVVVEGERSDRVSVQRWFTIRRGRLVTVEFELAPSADMSWSAAGDEVFHSLR